MAHYAILNEENIVIQVIVGRNENEIVDGISDWEAHYTEVTGKICKRTSYNAIGGKWRDPQTNQITNNPGFRKNYAGIGYTYDPSYDAFIPPKPFNSWILNQETGLWNAPTPKPNDDKMYRWIEESLSWEEISL